MYMDMAGYCIHSDLIDVIQQALHYCLQLFLYILLTTLRQRT